MQEIILSYVSLFFSAVTENSLTDEFIIKSLRLKVCFVLFNSLHEIKTYKYVMSLFIFSNDSNCMLSYKRRIVLPHWTVAAKQKTQ